MARSWYAYSGEGDPELVDNYIASSGTPTCRNGRVLCAVLAPDTSPKTTKPAVISQNLAYYIGNGIANGGATPIGTSKKYAYFFPLQG